MPELPEVETTVLGLKSKVLGRTFFDIWADVSKIIKKPQKIKDFARNIKGKKILDIRRIGKNIIFDLSTGYSLLVHQKMTGHLLYGKWQKMDGKWEAVGDGPIKNDPMNKFIRIVFFLDNGYQIALSDLRKFAKVELWKAEDLLKSQGINSLGIDALDKKLTLRKFKEIIRFKKGTPRQAQGRKIKQVLMDQSVITGIGNIYSDEILFLAKINPLRTISTLSDEELESIYTNLKNILKKAIVLGGTSVSDYRIPTGERGEYGTMLKVYRKENKSCPVCGGSIKRIKIGGRSAHFCPICQK